MKNFLIFIVSLFIINQANAQLALKVADHQFNHLHYKTAIPFYKSYLKKEKHTKEITALRKLAISYVVLNKNIEAESVYKKIVLLDTNADDMVNYLKLLLKNKHYDIAKSFVQQDIVSKSEDLTLQVFVKSVNELDKISAFDKSLVSVKRLDFNTKKSDYAPSFYSNGIVFSRAKKRADHIDINQKWNSKKYNAKLFFSSRDVDFKEATALNVNIVGKNTYGPASFNNQSKSMYYTANKVQKQKIDKLNQLGIFSSSFNSSTNKWQNDNNFTQNGIYYSNIHPSISKDGKTIYFSSNMAGGFGGMDIYKSIWENGNWTIPENLGPDVNTSGNELFPYSYEDSVLYFSTDGMGGLGGLDIYTYNLNSKVEAQNLGAPFNSSADDFGFLKNPKSDYGFFSSSRLEKESKDDVYMFKLFKPKPRVITINVLDDSTGKPIDNAKLRVYSRGNKDMSFYTLMDGNVSNLKFEVNEVYKLLAAAEGYVENSVLIKTGKSDTKYDIKLKKFVLTDSTLVNTSMPIFLSESYTIQGIVKDKANHKLLSRANVVINNAKTGEEVYNGFTDENGAYHFANIQANTKYYIDIRNNGVVLESKLFKSKSLESILKNPTKSNYVVDFDVDHFVPEETVKPVVTTEYKTSDFIYFELNKYTITTDAAGILDEFATILNAQPQLKIELNSYTDIRGSAEYNMTLSRKRATASANYLVKKGVARKRIKARGRGETNPIVSCGKKLHCDEAQHKINRRTEIVVK